MRNNWLSNRIFKSYDDDLVDHCCEAWNKLVDQPSDCVKGRRGSDQWDSV
jgi:hypothetical protein